MRGPLSLCQRTSVHISFWNFKENERPLSLCQRTSQLLLRGRRRTTKETDTLIPSISYCTNIDNKTIDGPQSPRVKIFDREFKRKQVKIQSFSVNLWFEHFGIVVLWYFCFCVFCLFSNSILYICFWVLVQLWGGCSVTELRGWWGQVILLWMLLLTICWIAWR
jgi:hypothetical protein